MKKFFVCLICLLLCVTGAIGLVSIESNTLEVGAVQAESVNKITVTGSGEVRLVPDVAIVSLGVETLNESLSVAQKENADNISNLITILKDLGVPEENIKTKNFYVYQRYDYSQGEKFIGYNVSNYLDFKTKDVDNVGNLISKLLENGANRFSGISFTIDNYDEAYNMALEKALENAKNKAKAITNSEIVSSEICEEGSYSMITRDSYSFSNSSSDNMSIMKGEICIKANIKVIFEYEG